ncbi:MAG: MFS transporter [Acidimicrobiales bacterium]
MHESTKARPSLGAVFQQPGYRQVWLTNMLSSLANGSSRFIFVWLIKDLTDWDPAAALLGIAIGLPALLLSVPGGSLADRLAPSKMGRILLAASALLFGLTAVVASTDLISVPVAVGLAFLTAVPLAMLMPMLQAVVPALIPQHQLLQAVALQNMGLMAGMIIGAFAGGAIIVVFDTAGAIFFLAGVCLLALVAMSRAQLPDAPAKRSATPAVSMATVAREALSTEPLRTLLFLTVITGVTMAANMILIPVIARDVLQVNALKAGLINALMGVGMMITSVLLARRGQLARPGRTMLVTLSAGLGTGLFLLGWSDVFALTVLVAFMWGGAGGSAMALLRTLTQLNTPSDRMGRVMGLATLAQFGAFPLGALVLFGLVGVTGPANAMMITGAFVSLAIWSQWLRPVLRDS